MGEWSQLEYATISTECARTGSQLYLTSVPLSLVENLPAELHSHTASGRLVATSTEVPQLPGIVGDRVCLLDPAAKADLKPEDGESFDAFVFGGILGQFPYIADGPYLMHQKQVMILQEVLVARSHTMYNPKTKRIN